jgi:hypothetical protein
MRTSAGSRGWFGRTVLALSALAALAATASPAAADDWNHRHRYHNNGFFSFGFGTPGYYYAPPPRYYYAPPPAYYYYPPPPPAYYYPPPAYYGPSASFNFVVPFGHHH